MQKYSKFDGDYKILIHNNKPHIVFRHEVAYSLYLNSVAQSEQIGLISDRLRSLESDLRAAENLRDGALQACEEINIQYHKKLDQLAIALKERDQAAANWQTLTMRCDQALVERDTALLERDQALTERDAALLASNQSVMKNVSATLQQDDFTVGQDNVSMRLHNDVQTAMNPLSRLFKPKLSRTSLRAAREDRRDKVT